MRTIVLLALGYCAAMRVFELVLSRRNASRMLAVGGRQVTNDGLYGIVIVHVLWLAGLALEELLLGPLVEARAPRILGLLLFALAEAVRFACMASLGPHWNVRVIVRDGAPRVRSGLYRMLRHPNYVAVAVLLAALPLALGLLVTPVVVLPFGAWALRRRMRLEEQALAEAEARSGRA